jgi:hypothetical protein
MPTYVVVTFAVRPASRAAIFLPLAKVFAGMVPAAVMVGLL